MNFELNIKRILKVILIDTVIFLVILAMILAYFNALFVDQLRFSAMFLLSAGIPFLFICGGAIGILLCIFLNIRNLIYNKKNALVVNEDKIIYNTYNAKQITIEKENIERMYTTFHNDDYLIRNKYIGIQMKKELPSVKNRFNILSIFRAVNTPYLIYINISELKGNPEEIALSIENILNIQIKKKEKNMFWGKNIFLGDKL